MNTYALDVFPMLNYVRKNWLNCSVITCLFALSGNSCLSNSIMTGVSVHWRLSWGAVGTCYSHTNKLMDKVKPERKFSNFANPLPSPLLYECCFDLETWGKLSPFGRQLLERERGALLSCILLLSEFQKMSPLWNCIKAFLFQHKIVCQEFQVMQQASKFTMHLSFVRLNRKKNCLSRLQCFFHF